MKNPSEVAITTVKRWGRLIEEDFAPQYGSEKSCGKVKPGSLVACPGLQ